jgi:hypothetical protein
MLPDLSLLRAGSLGKPGLGRVVPEFLQVKESGPRLADFLTSSSQWYGELSNNFLRSHDFISRDGGIPSITSVSQ